MAASATRRCLPFKHNRSQNTRHLSCERLEERLAMYSATGSSWSNPNVSFSFVPDGSSSLFSKLDAIAPREVWQREFARSLQTWANVSNLNFREVADNGTSGGDIRLTANALNGYLAYAYYPGGGIGGDITLATEHTFRVGADYDLYSVLLHEAGHSLGLGHTPGSVMNSSYQGILSGLTADDIAGIRSIYGARAEDAFDAAARNDSLATATVLTLDSSGVKSLMADLTSLSDLDFFRVTAPAGSDGTLQVSVDARDISLLQGRVQVFDASGNLISSADATTYEGQAQLNLTGIAAGQTYYVVADGAVSDPFGMGKYGLSIAFGGGSAPPPEPPPEPPPSGVAADRFESNNTLSTARGLGKFNIRTESGLTLHTSTDKDFLKFTPKNTGTFRLTTAFATGDGTHEIKIYDSKKVLVATRSGTSIDLSLTGSRQYFVQVGSPSGTLDTYSLSIQRLTASALKKRPGGGALGDGYFADAESAAGHADDHHGRATAVDQLLASWQPEEGIPSNGAIGLTSKQSVFPDWSAPVRRAEQSDAGFFAATSLSSAALSQIFERLGHKGRDGLACADGDSVPSADNESNFALALSLN